jgi:hypothetical protein
LRFVCLAERFNRHADDHLIDGLALSRVARDGDSLVNVKRAFEKDFALLKSDFLPGDAGDNMKLVISELFPLTLEVFVIRIWSPADRQIVSGLNTLNLPACESDKALRQTPFSTISSEPPARSTTFHCSPLLNPPGARL